MQQHFRIIGSAGYLPQVRISAEELDQRLGLQAGWTLQHTGIRYRHAAIGSEDVLSMARTVATEALQDAGVQVRDLDLIVDGSLSSCQPIPCNAALIQRELGPEAAGIPSIDVHASCLGFVAALQMINGLCASGSVRRALLVCSETPLRGVDWSQADSACLMGDGAAAVVLEAAPPIEPCVFAMQTFGDAAELCEVRGGGHRLPSYEYTENKRSLYLFQMDGKALHRMASKRLPPLIAEVLHRTGCRLSDLHVVPHQASGPAVEFMARRLGIARERLHTSVESHGNLVAAGIPFVLHHVRKQLDPGTRLMLVGTAAGYSQAAAILTL